VSRRAGKVAYHVESPALPPAAIAPGGVHGGFEAAGNRLAELVAGHQQPLARSLRRRGIRAAWHRGDMMKTSPSLLREPSGRPVMLPQWPRAKRPSLWRCIDFSLGLLARACAVQRKRYTVRSDEHALLCASPYAQALRKCCRAARALQRKFNSQFWRMRFSFFCWRFARWFCCPNFSMEMFDRHFFAPFRLLTRL
jgi:hypothetical protein